MRRGALRRPLRSDVSEDGVPDHAVAADEFDDAGVQRMGGFEAGALDLLSDRGDGLLAQVRLLVGGECAVVLQRGVDACLVPLGQVAAEKVCGRSSASSICTLLNTTKIRLAGTPSAESVLIVLIVSACCFFSLTVGTRK